MDKVHSLGRYVYMLHNNPGSLPDTLPYWEYYVSCYLMANNGCTFRLLGFFVVTHMLLLDDAIELTAMSMDNWDTRIADIDVGTALGSPSLTISLPRHHYLYRIPFSSLPFPSHSRLSFLEILL